ncbi:MAG: hypothetical protein FVQ81_07310, partial [Candidatus Glassbacteria bacterium]|nr:hypothetical protein [Candidatus Glassbacteria bacterium]
MDTLAHGLWGGLAAGWKKRFGLAFLFGIAPDLSSFGALMAIRIVSGTFAPGRPSVHTLPDWLHTAYNCSHSLIVIGAVWLVLRFTARGVAVPFLAWPLHIICDIPTHSKAFFPTPFLFPLSDYTYDGFSWGQSWFMILNYTCLLVTAAAWVGYRHRRRKSSGVHRKKFMLADPLAGQASP